MTPKEQVNELIEKFKPYSYYDGHDMTTRSTRERSNRDSAIECAIIAVEILVDVMPSVNGRPPNYQTINQYCSEYWEEVLTELKAMQ